MLTNSLSCRGEILAESNSNFFSPTLPGTGVPTPSPQSTSLYSFVFPSFFPIFSFSHSMLAEVSHDDARGLCQQGRFPQEYVTLSSLDMLNFRFEFVLSYSTYESKPVHFFFFNFLYFLAKSVIDLIARLLRL